MKHFSKKHQKIRVKAETFRNNTAQDLKVLAQLEACLSRQENQKVTSKSKNA